MSLVRLKLRADRRLDVSELQPNWWAFVLKALGFYFTNRPSRFTSRQDSTQTAKSAVPTSCVRLLAVLVLMMGLLGTSIAAQAETAVVSTPKVNTLKPPAEIGVTQNVKPQAPITVIEAKALAASTQADQQAADAAGAASSNTYKGDLSGDELIALGQAGIRVPGVTDNPAISWGRGGDILIPGQTQPSSQSAEGTQSPVPSTDAKPKPPLSTQVIPGESLVLATPVIDPTNFLNPANKQVLDQRIRELHAADLVQIGVVVVPSTGELDIFDYGLPIATRWQLGSAAKDNGLLIVLAYADRKVFVFTGYGVEGALPDAALSRIIREDMKPAFSQDQYAQGLSNGIDAMVKRLQTDPMLLRQADQQLEKNATLGQFALVIGLIALAAGSFIATKLGRIGGGTVASIAYGGLGLAAGLSAAQLIFGALLVFGVTLIGVLQLLALFSQGAAASGMGRGGFGGRGGGFGGGGFSGGGGGFGGGGAGGSW